ncbi:hypothetical protein G6F57_017240 [Rhizopus arrhizus]|nr:hypothetical protein G6F57_017240 [Rhizopus arrhizus]
MRTLLRLRREHAGLLAQVGGAGGHQQDLVLGLEHAIDDAHQHDDAHVVVEPRVDDQRLQRRVGIALGRRHAGHDGFQDLVDAHPRLGAGQHGLGGVDADHGLDFGLGALDVGGGQVDLVDHRHHFQTLLDRGVAVGHRLRFHALGGIDDQQRALAGGQRAADFIGEVDVARGIDEVQVVGLPVLGQVRQRHRLRLDRDATLALDRVGVAHLRFHLTGLQATAELDDAVGQRGLAVVDMGNDGEVANMLHA